MEPDDVIDPYGLIDPSASPAFGWWNPDGVDYADTHPEETIPHSGRWWEKTEHA